MIDLTKLTDSERTWLAEHERKHAEALADNLLVRYVASTQTLVLVSPAPANPALD